MNQNADLDTRTPRYVIHLKQLESLTDEERVKVESHLLKHCERLGAEFREINHLDRRIDPTGHGPDEYEAHAHTSGKGVDAAARASAGTIRSAADTALTKLERELRTQHDKQIFKQRRNARRNRH